MSKLDVRHAEHTLGGDAHVIKEVLNNNVSARIVNPLAHLSREQLASEVSAFCSEAGLQGEEVYLQKGALVAQAGPGNYSHVADLSPDEVHALQREQTNKWSLPITMWLTIAIASVGAGVQGWDQTGSNGANLSFPQEFGIGTTSTRDTFLVGLVNAAPYISASILGVWLFDPMSIFMGRKPIIFIAGLFCVAGPLGGAFTKSWEELFATRIVLGIGMGLKGAAVPVFATECSPTNVRGSLTSSWQFATTLGITLGLAANLIVNDVGRIAWRLQIGSAFIPAIPLVLGIFYFTAESPRWLVKKGRFVEAWQSLVRIRNHKVQAGRDLYAIVAQIREENIILGDRGNVVSRFTELFTIPRNRRGLLAGSIAMIGQQLCGINVIAFYSSTVFVNAGATAKEALIASFGFGLVNFVFCFPGFWFMDHPTLGGRRRLLLAGYPMMAISLLIVSLVYIIPQDNKAHLGLVAFFIYTFTIGYSYSQGPVAFVYSAEAHALKYRELAMAWGVATCLFWASVLSITFPRMLDVFGGTGAFLFYTGLNVVAYILVMLFLRETRGLTLEELDYVFSVPHSTFIRYTLSKSYPYWIRTNILRQKLPPLEPLFHYGGDRASSIGSNEKEY